jgi:hypothetical protein
MFVGKWGVGEVTWATVPVLLSLSVLAMTVALLAMDERNRRKFATLKDLDGLGERLKLAELMAARGAERHEKTEREIDKLISEATSLARETSRLQGQIDRLISHAESERGHHERNDRENRVREEKEKQEMRDRLARIEAKVDNLVERK